MRYEAAALATAGLMAMARMASAAPSARLVYGRAPDAASCPDEAALRGAVAARFGYDPFFAWAKRTVIVQVWRRGEQYASRVQILDEQGVARGTRELASRSGSCSELFDATALAISIALDATSQEEAPAVDPPVQPSPSPPPAPATPPVPPFAADTQAEESPAPPPPATPRRFFLGADILGSEGTAPSVSAGLALSGGLRARSLSAALELRVDAPAGTTGSDPAQASSWLLAAAVVPCVHAGPAAICAVGTLGQLVASASGIRSPSTGTALFAAAGARVGWEWEVTEAWSVRAHADGLVDLARPEYDVDSRTVWRAPLFAFGLGAGVALRIP